MAKHINGASLDASTTKRPGIHSKNGTSKNKSSKNYKKKYRGQGR